MTPLCIYHGNCADGFTAAWVVRKALGSDVEFHPGVYQQQPPDVTGRDVLMVDFSYKRPVIEEMRTAAKSILILDHHKTAESDLAGIQAPFGPTWQRHLENVYQDTCEGVDGTPYALFDIGRSGAQITWDFFNPGKPRPLLVDYTGDRDLWKFDLPLSREVNAYVFANEYTFRNWDYLHAQIRDHMDVQRIAEWGGAIEKKHHKDVAELIGVTKRRMVIGGIEVPVANLPYTLTSDAGHLMAQGEAFAACYWDTPEGRVFSLRSTDAGTDVSEVAKQYGGGGHRNASGFKMPIGWEGDAGA
jgi:oligoribonuclease NrnB/cAMP/cGMP phosphodiesterase (DHH superfamily)